VGGSADADYHPLVVTATEVVRIRDRSVSQIEQATGNLAANLLESDEPSIRLDCARKASGGSCSFAESLRPAARAEPSRSDA
jgi:hypothetical protein